MFSDEELLRILSDTDSTATVKDLAVEVYTRRLRDSFHPMSEVPKIDGWFVVFDENKIAFNFALYSPDSGWSVPLGWDPGQATHWIPLPGLPGRRR